MAKKSKLREKAARFSMPSEVKRTKDLEQYRREIVDLNVETARAQRFLMLMREWFNDVRPRFVEQYLRGLERRVKIKSKDFVFTGRVDALYGNVIVEFESNLKKTLKHAQEQLREYVLCLVQEKEQTNFICIASDGATFVAYTPSWDKGGTAPKHPKDIELRKIDEIDFCADGTDATKAFFWLDRYFFRVAQLSPTTEEFVRDFGINSPAYAYAIDLLQAEWERIHEKSEFEVIYKNWEKYLRFAYGTSVADAELFLRHTYLASFAKLLAYMRLSGKFTIPTTGDVAAIFTGKFFRQRGIVNFLEEDFLSWVAREKVRDLLVNLVQRVATLLERYNLAEISEDVLKSLYQELVDPATRHALGEFYTPDWLADRIMHHTLAENPQQSVLDPACGSGTFLYFAIKLKRAKLGDSNETLKHIQETVVGVDIHPLAVTIARTNYILGLGELLKRRRKEFSIPVYMANSIRLPERFGQMETTEKVHSFRVELDDQVTPIPEVFTEHSAAFDEAVDVCERYAKDHLGDRISTETFQTYARKHISELKANDETLGVLFELAQRMHELIKRERNSIWTYILKNVYRPIFLKKKFDWIIGNPPWLSYKDVEKGTYQEFLRKMILDRYGLLRKGQGHLITHLELATLFFCACLYEFGASGARIAFVLTRAIFTGDQHDAFRRRSFNKVPHQTGITEVWDLEGVSPLFKVPSCVVFGTRPYFSIKPIPAVVLSGELLQRNSSSLEAEKRLTTRESQLYTVKNEDRSFWSEDPDAKFSKGSPYGSKFAEGATIVPRSCWFVDIPSDEPLGFYPSAPFVRTDVRATEQAKDAYKDLILEGNIEKEFLYATLLSTDLLPFGFLEYRSVVLPLKSSGDYFTIVTAERAKKENYTHLQQWLVRCEKEWKQRRGEKADRMTIYERLDHVRGITQQSSKPRFKVLYPMSATYLCAAVVENQKVIKTIDGQRLVLKNFIADYVTFFMETDSENEANYLATILNSPIIDEHLKPMQAKGLWGPRHICMKVWELPIPAFDEKKKGHCELAELGKLCTERVKKFLPELDTKDITPGKIGRLRNAVRERLRDELKEIDGIVKEMIR